MSYNVLIPYRSSISSLSRYVLSNTVFVYLIIFRPVLFNTSYPITPFSYPVLLYLIILLFFLSRPFPIPSFSILYILILYFLSRLIIYFPFFLAYSSLSLHIPSFPLFYILSLSYLHNYFPSYPVLFSFLFPSSYFLPIPSILLTHILPIPSYLRIFFLSRLFAF